MERLERVKQFTEQNILEENDRYYDNDVINNLFLIIGLLCVTLILL